MDAEGTQVRHHGRRLDHPVYHEPLDHVADHPGRDDGQGKGDEGVYMVEGVEPVGGEGAYHDQLAMEDIDDIHDAEYERESARIGGVHTSHEKARDKGLNEESHQVTFSPSTVSRGRAPAFPPLLSGRRWSVFHSAPARLWEGARGWRRPRRILSSRSTSWNPSCAVPP